MFMLEENVHTPEQTVILLEEIFKKMPLIYKRLVVFQDFLMVLGGLKAGNNLDFSGNAYQEKDFLEMKSVLKSVGLEIADYDEVSDGNGNLLRKKFVFSPLALKRETLNSEFAPPYELGMSLADYIKKALLKGYDFDGISGKIYSFPETAIRSYLKEQDKSSGKFVATFEERYFIKEPMGEDAVARERMKSDFFGKLNNNQSFLKIRASEQLKESNSIWSDHLPKENKDANSRKKSIGDNIRKIFKSVFLNSQRQKVPISLTILKISDKISTLKILEIKTLPHKVFEKWLENYIHILRLIFIKLDRLKKKMLISRDIDVLLQSMLSVTNGLQN